MAPGIERPLMATKRIAPKPAAPSASPLVHAAVFAAALGYGLWLLIDRGRVSWPPHALLSGAYTLAGCLALVGPIILARRDGSDVGLGELLWLTGGLLVWVFDLAALAGGSVREVAWLNPLGVRAMGLTILAVLVAGWRAHGPGRTWTWTNVTGWLLGLFWVGMAAASLAPGR